ncbi:hypothetical protein ACFFMN_13985 [Planobispora siamensis]|nr:hypothetical protein [Planobispora siamensis]
MDPFQNDATPAPEPREPAQVLITIRRLDKSETTGLNQSEA